MAAGTTATNPDSSHAGRPASEPAGVVVEGLFADYGGMILGLCRLLLRDPLEAEDAAQQVFLSAHRSVLGGSVPRDAAAWLAAIARNECRARARKRMREPLALPDLPSDLPDPLAAAISRMDCEAIWAALAALPRRQRQAFLLREVGGLSYDELGVALGVTRPAVESLLFRARRRLRSAVERGNLVLVPLAVRDQVARFVPPPGAARVAVVGAGLGLTAVGVVGFPDQHGHAVHARGVQPSPVRAHRDAVAPGRAQPAARALPPSLLVSRLPSRHVREDAVHRRAHEVAQDRPQVESGVTAPVVDTTLEPQDSPATTVVPAGDAPASVQEPSSSDSSTGSSTGDGEPSGSTSESSVVVDGSSGSESSGTSDGGG